MKYAVIVTTLLLTACSTDPGDFCDLYQDVDITSEEAAQALVQFDRPAAESIAVNEATAESCD